MQQGRAHAVQMRLRQCSIDQVGRLGRAGEEGGKRSMENVISLRMVHDIKAVATALEASGTAAAAAAAVRVSGGADPPAVQVGRHRALLAAAGGEFDVIEPILALHATLLRRFAPMEVEPLAQLLVHAASLATSSRWFPVAGALLTQADNLPREAARATCVNWEWARVCWDEGERGVAHMKHHALTIANKLVERAVEVSTSAAAVSLGVADPASVHERAALAQACRYAAVWGIHERRTCWEKAVELYERALSICGTDAALLSQRCETHAAYAAWLEAEYRSWHHVWKQPAAMRDHEKYELAHTELRIAAEEEAAQSKGGSGRGGGRSGGGQVASTETLTMRIALLRSYIEAYEQKRGREKESQRSLAASALRQHAACARAGVAHDHTALFGIIGLWFEYGGGLAEAEKELCSLPTHKLLPLISQLSCRLGACVGEAHAFQTALRAVLLHVARAHLHVVLPHLLALSYGDRYALGEETPPSMDRGQLEAARDLINELKRAEQPKPPPAAPGQPPPKASSPADVGAIVQATELLYDFYLQLAWVSKDPTTKLHEAARTHASGPTLPKLKDLMASANERKAGTRGDAWGVRKGSELFKMVQEGHASLAALPTHGASASGASSTSELHGDVVHFSHFGPAAPPTPSRSRSVGGARGEAEFATAGGINLPKIVYCYGDDGRMHKQLVKGRDDLRGDAVMQQVMGLVNVLFERDDATRQRALRMRTYRIVPLAPTAGIVQWVDDTMMLSTYLTGPVSAHERYRPNDWSHAKCRKMMSDVHKSIGDGNQKKSAALDVYRQIEQHLRPVMHHFFLERYLSPAAWFARRAAYAASVAAGSMIGYVLGLGDRHSSNILIDTRSAELVHIDLGIAFDKGRLLKTPETVPFRLTRDLEDGLGVSGVEGVLTGGCEHTMRVLRANSEALTTILEVMLRNPLYTWSLDPTRSSGAAGSAGGGAGGAKSAGGASGDSGGVGGAAPSEPNREAERAMMSIQNRLRGRVTGTSTALAVQGQVNALLKEARAPENLCRMYDGWAAWL